MVCPSRFNNTPQLKPYNEFKSPAHFGACRERGKLRSYISLFKTEALQHICLDEFDD
jgi:hypothetical protein